MHVLIAAVPWPLVALVVLSASGLVAMLMKPKLRDPRLERTFADKPGKYDKPAPRYRR